MKKEDIEKVRKLAIAQLSKETGIADYFVQIDLQDEFVDRCIKIASQSKPQLNIEKVVSGIVDSLGEPSNDNDYHIHSVNGNRWITHKEIGSGEPLKQWLKSEIEKHIEQSKPEEITCLEDANKNLRERHSIALDTIEELKEEIAGHEKMRKRAAEVVVDLSNKLSKSKEELEQIKPEEIEWISSEIKPESDKPVLAIIESGKYPVRVMWVKEHSISTEDWEFHGAEDYNETDDKYYWPEGWYEWNEMEEVHWMCKDVLLWTELPIYDKSELQTRINPVDTKTVDAVDPTFWRRLEMFVSNIQVNDMAGEEEKQYIIHVIESKK